MTVEEEGEDFLKIRKAEWIKNATEGIENQTAKGISAIFFSNDSETMLMKRYFRRPTCSQMEI